MMHTNNPHGHNRLVAEQAGKSFRDAVKVETSPIEAVMPGPGEVRVWRKI